VLELHRTSVSAVGCFASAEAAGATMRTAGAYACRVAPDEVLLLARAGTAAKAVEAVADEARRRDPDAVVLDVTDGWAVWTLAGSDAREAFARLSALELPDEGFTQGDVAHVPVKVVALGDRVHLLVPAMWGAYLRERILEVGLPVAEAAKGAPWAAPRRRRET
jgi:sarcosine oxidase gamma subunit